MAQEKKVTQSTDDQTTQNDPNQPQVLGGSSQGAVTSPTARVASFSSGQQNTPGSGRFTNIQRYLDANKSATDSLGAKANKTFNTQFQTGQKDVDAKNQALSAAFNKGRETLQTGQGFNDQLKQIGTGFETGFTDFGNRQGFDTAGQQAMQLAQNQDYGNIASGQAIDETGLTAQQQQALQGAQGLAQNVKTNLGNIETERGRSDLFSKVLQPKQGYTSGQRSFDQLFLGGALGGIKSNLQGQQNIANQLTQSTAGQQKSLDEIISGESSLTSGLTQQAAANQDIFDRVFGDQKNIDFINNLRTKRFTDLSGALTSGGTINADDAALLGLGNVNNYTYQARTPVVDSRFAGVDGKVTAQPVNDLSQINTLNTLRDPAAISKYISQGQNALTTQDITQQGDYDVYKSLQNLALGRDTGKLAGTSQLGNSIQAGSLGDINALSTDLNAANQAFQTDLAAGKLDNNYRYWDNVAYLGGDQALDLSNQIMNNRGTSVEELKNQFNSDYHSTRDPDSYAKYADYLKTINTGYEPNTSQKYWNLDSTRARNSAQARALSSSVSKLDDLGAFNRLNVDNTQPLVPSRFKGLV